MQFVAASVVVVHLIYVLDVTLAIAARPQPAPWSPPSAADPSLMCVACAKFVRHKSQMVDSGGTRDPTVCRRVCVCVRGEEERGERGWLMGIGNWDLCWLLMGRLICDSRRLLTHR